ncbi:MAG TPA: cell division protein FtsZ [Salinivirgaceae bacterium]|nr:cell division protein FtsZ [Salinivirgaceae bacterium]
MSETIMNFDLPTKKSSIIKVIGVGGGGGNAVTHMFREGITNVDFVICNTDAQALEQSPIPVKIHLGPTISGGCGAGNRPERGKQAAIESLDQITELLKHNTKMVFITAGMGGGTGTGAAPIIAQEAKNLEILTVGIVSIPFLFEGKRRLKQAIEGLEEMRKNVDALLVISNEKIREIHGDLGMKAAFAKADNILTTAAKGIAEIITVPGLVNVDFEDVYTVMHDSGVALMGSAVAEGENRAIDAIQEALTSPLLNNNDINGAKDILLNITSGKNNITLDEMTIITDYLQEAAGKNADVIWGANIDESLEDELIVTVIATGFNADAIPELHGNSKPKVIKHDLNTSKPTVTENYSSSSTEIITPAQPIVSTGLNSSEDTEDTVSNNHLKSQKKYNSIDYLKNIRNIDEIENIPAIKRREIIFDKSATLVSEDEVRFFSLAEEDGNIKLRKNNSYLDKNVD